MWNFHAFHRMVQHPQINHRLEENAQQPESRSGGLVVAKWLNHPSDNIVVSKEIFHKKGMKNEDEPCLKLMTSSCITNSSMDHLKHDAFRADNLWPPPPARGLSLRNRFRNQ